MNRLFHLSKMEDRAQLANAPQLRHRCDRQPTQCIEGCLEALGMGYFNHSDFRFFQIACTSLTKCSPLNPPFMCRCSGGLCRAGFGRAGGLHIAEGALSNNFVHMCILHKKRRLAARWEDRTQITVRHAKTPSRQHHMCKLAATHQPRFLSQGCLY